MAPALQCHFINLGEFMNRTSFAFLFLVISNSAFAENSNDLNAKNRLKATEANIANSNAKKEEFRPRTPLTTLLLDQIEKWTKQSSENTQKTLHSDAPSTFVYGHNRGAGMGD
jgi:hypothetical protein